jgi:hypothetical protein
MSTTLAADARGYIGASFIITTATTAASSIGMATHKQGTAGAIRRTAFSILPALGGLIPLAAPRADGTADSPA